MCEKFIALLDSGIGGLSVLKSLQNKFLYESFIYLGDNDNSPYGNRSVYDLTKITLKNIDLIKSYPVKAIVVACNTLSVNILPTIKEYSNLPCFGIFPPVERCVMNKKRTLLLATKLTAEKYVNYNSYIDVVGLKDLATDIENNIHSINNIKISDHVSGANDCTFKNCKNYYETVILGCTHYSFVKKQIFDHFQPQNLTSGESDLILNLNKFLQNEKSSVKTKRNRVLFIGKNAVKNEKIYNTSGQTWQNY